VKLSASVMAHPNRSAEVAELLTALDRDVPVHWDPEGPPAGGGDRVWRQARATWQLHDPAADWHVLIQDDAIVCPDLLAGLEQALEHVPADAVVSPYLGTGRNVPRRWQVMAEQADKRGAPWIVSGRVMWGVCLALPVARILEMITWCDRKAGMPDDMRVGAWAVRNQLDVWYPWPSLVDHRTVPSLTKSRARDRVARRHHDGSALDIDWSGPVVTDPMLARHRGPRSGPRGAWRVRSVTTAPGAGR
jgi:hypothetical protein